MEPLPLYLGYTKLVGPDHLTWIPVARKEVYERLSKRELSPIAHNMLEAMVTLKVTDLPWKEYSVFENIVWALNGHVPKFGTLDVPPSWYAAYAITIMRSINKENEFSPEVKSYISGIMEEEGICLGIDGLELAQPYINKLLEKSNPGLPAQVEQAWNKIKSTNLLEYQVNLDDPISAQVGKLVTIRLYLTTKQAKTEQEMKNV